MDFQLPKVESSSYIRTLRIITSGNSLPPHLLDTTRPLSDCEVYKLEGQGNRCDARGRLRVHHDFMPEAVRDSRFAGTCVLGRFSKGGHGSWEPGIRSSVVADAVIGSGAVVDRCPRISGTILDRGVVVIDGTIVGSPNQADERADPTGAAHQ